VLATSTNNIFLKILCYTAAFTVAGAQIYHNEHWLSDVIARGLIGHFVGDYVSSVELKI
jgi:membrane-associated phospholipid phosphatase